MENKSQSSFIPKKVNYSKPPTPIKSDFEKEN